MRAASSTSKQNQVNNGSASSWKDNLSELASACLISATALDRKQLCLVDLTKFIICFRYTLGYTVQYVRLPLDRRKDMKIRVGVRLERKEQEKEN